MKYYYFNFHRDLNKIEIPFDFKECGFTSINKSQNFIVRTNCIDCLDRTNSMQYFIGKSILKYQMEEENIYDIETYCNKFKHMFYNNGNYLSIQYSGTPALSSNYILEGKNSILGKLKDGYFSLKRYYINRKEHGKLNDLYNIITGNIKEGTFKKNKEYSSIQIFLIILYLFFFNRNMAILLLILHVFLNIYDFIDHPNLNA